MKRYKRWSAFVYLGEVILLLLLIFVVRKLPDFGKKLPEKEYTITETTEPEENGFEEKTIEIEQEETYGERFEIPTPDELVFISWFSGGEVFRSGCCYKRGLGKIFYFKPGHEEYPIYYRDDIRQVLANAVDWAKPSNGPKTTFGNVPPVEKNI